jgi:GNAT superfamily N-acetyltransferase
MDSKTNNMIPSEKLIGVITGRPITVTFLKRNPETKETNSNPLALTSLKPLNGSLALTSLKPFLKVYYIDYLCVDKNYRKKGIAEQLIQTHEYNQSHLNKGISVSLFKREDELTGIVPLTVYKSYCFNMRNWNCPEPLDPKMTLLQGDKQNMYYFYNFIKEKEREKEGKWQLTILPDMSNLMELISSKNMFISMILIDGNIEAAFIFKKSCTYIEKEKEVICCIASIYNKSKMQEDEFIRGFKVSLWTIIERTENKKFHYLTVEDTSDNGCIIRNIERKTHPTVISPTAYFFYNFAYNTFKSGDVFIIC